MWRSVYPDCAKEWRPKCPENWRFFVDYEEFAAALPRERMVEFTSPEELEEAFHQIGVDQPTRQLKRGDFRARLAMSSTKYADLFADRYSTAISLQLKLPPEVVGFLIPRSASGHFVANGEDVGNDMLLVFAGGCEADISGPPLIGSEAIAIPESRFIELTEALCPTADRPEVTAIFDGDPVQLHALRKALGDLVTRPESDVHVEDVANVVAEAIAWMGDSCSQWEPHYLTVNAARTRVAKLVQAYIEEHYAEAVHIEDLCRVTTVGARTVQRSFREYFDLTVSNYVKIVRLDSARRQLASAHKEETSVTRIAMDNGCSHLGRFSIEFRERFGQSPKQTLATSANQK